MAIYHATTKPVARSAGRSAIAVAAYRAGLKLTDERTGEVSDYSRKRGIESRAIFLPDGAPQWAADRGRLWNAAEAAERRKDARIAREWEIALPAELTAEQRRELAHGFARELVKRYGVAADVCIHAPSRRGDDRNHHAHILLTTRQLGPDGFKDKASIELSDTKRRGMGLPSAADEVADVRKLWEQHANRALERAGVAARIDSRSLDEQGADRQTTPRLGLAATSMTRRGAAIDREPATEPRPGRRRRQRVEAAKRQRIEAELQRIEGELREQETRQAARTPADDRADAETAADRRDGITAPAPMRDWVKWRTQVLTDAGYEQKIAAELAAFGRVSRTREGLRFDLKHGGGVMDTGDRIRPASAQANDTEIYTALRMAQAKGWGSPDKPLTITGSAEFRERAAREAARIGLTVADADLQAVVQDAAARQAEEQAARGLSPQVGENSRPAHDKPLKHQESAALPDYRAVDAAVQAWQQATTPQARRRAAQDWMQGMERIEKQGGDVAAANDRTRKALGGGYADLMRQVQGLARERQRQRGLER
jgi:hypothetical protein